jgi:hypothetical protein
MWTRAWPPPIDVLLAFGRVATRLVCISNSTTLMEKLAQQNQSVEVSGVIPHIQNEHRDISIFFGNITTFLPIFRDGK